LAVTAGLRYDIVAFRVSDAFLVGGGFLIRYRFAK
jgi:hypothetical protein